MRPPWRPQRRNQRPKRSEISYLKEWRRGESNHLGEKRRSPALTTTYLTTCASELARRSPEVPQFSSPADAAFGTVPSAPPRRMFAHYIRNASAIISSSVLFPFQSDSGRNHPFILLTVGDAAFFCLRSVWSISPSTN